MDILYIVKLFPLKITKSSQEKTKNVSSQKLAHN